MVIWTWLHRMIVPYKFITLQLIRLSFVLSLIFLFVICLPGCNNKQEGSEVIYDGDKAVGVVIHADPEKGLLANDSLVQIKPMDHAEGILGNSAIIGNENLIAFYPAVPFSPGKTYQVFYKNKLISEFKIRNSTSVASTSITAVYPSIDTLPANLLKLYIVFSAPMQESVSSKYIQVIDEKGDTLKDVFLDLQPELWNESRTVLTTWFDPGRIKRDLQPNLEKGNPLIAGKQYKVIVSKRWSDKEGQQLTNDFQKQFVVIRRDEKVPDPTTWKLIVPPANSSDPLKISFDESLDYFLLTECIAMIDAQGRPVKTKIEISPGQRGVEIFPTPFLSPGKYKLRVLSKLEDLAGNNLNRPFDNDLRSAQKKEVPYVELEFDVAGNSSAL
ncbi:MAG: hypothetical protein ABW036_05890 [Flavitalea sp.]